MLKKWIMISIPIVVAVSILHLSCEDWGLGETTGADSPYKPNYAKDSLVVRAFLDANSLHSVPVHDACSYNWESKRIDMIFFANAPIRLLVLTAVLDSFEYLTISCHNKHLDTIDILDTIRTSLVLLLYSNSLRYLPPSIGKLVQISGLYIMDNFIESLPVELIDRRNPLGALKVYNNRLCNVPDSIADFLTRYDKEWRTSQVCD